AQKAGTKTTSQLDVVTAALNQRFGGTTAERAASVDVRLRVFSERLANIREEAGIKLLPVLTRIVDVMGQRLVPAFGEFIDAILPSAIAGLDRLASFLEGGGATEAGHHTPKVARAPAADLQ